MPPDRCGYASPAMKLRVRHRLHYAFTAPVSHGPTLIRMRPRGDAEQAVLSHAMTVDPEPAGRAELIGVLGEGVTQVWFGGPLDHFTVEAESVVVTGRENPFDFLIEQTASELPPDYSDVERQTLTPFFGSPDDGPADAALKELVSSVAAESGRQPVRFLAELSRRIAGALDVRVRPEGDAWPPSRTLSEGTGSCRDVAVLFNAAARLEGIPTRFVSGYQYQGDGADPTGHELHAWSEACLPAVGWRAFDATAGTAVDGRYVAVTAAPGQAGTLPTRGSFTGNAEQSLEAVVEIERLRD